MAKPEGRRPILGVDGGIILNCILKKWDGGMDWIDLNPLKTKRRLFYLKTQFVPRSKHFSSRL